MYFALLAGKEHACPGALHRGGEPDLLHYGSTAHRSVPPSDEIIAARIVQAGSTVSLHQPKGGHIVSCCRVRFILLAIKIPLLLKLTIRSDTGFLPLSPIL